MRDHGQYGRCAVVIVAALGLAPALALGGCRLPGGAPAGDAYHVTVEFADVLDLVPQAAVKVNDVTVGSVDDISLSGWTARVRLSIDNEVRLPANAVAAIRQSSLLGEKFVSLSAPLEEPEQGRLSDGAVIPRSRTERSAEVEEVLSALGLLLNGGGLAQLKIINQEVTTALSGREPVARDALRQLDAFIAGLDDQKANIVRAIESLDRFSAQVAEQRETIGHALDAMAPGLRVLADQRAQLTTALTALGDLSDAGTRVITESRQATAESLASLRPILEQLIRAGDSLPKALNFLLTFPFPPNVTGAITGNSTRLHVTLDLDGALILTNLLLQPGSHFTPGDEEPTPDDPLPGVPDLPDPPDVELPGLPLPSPSPSPTSDTSGGGSLCDILGLPIGCDQ